MTGVKLFLAVVLAFLCVGAQASDLWFSEDDCAQILERWAQDPDSVPQRLVDECQEALAAPGAPPPETLDSQDRPAALADADPCVGPNAADSVRCWGPWAALAPAAAGDPGPITLAEVAEYDTRPELADEFETVLDDPGLDLPLEGCPAGTPCGFATVVAGTLGQGQAADTRFSKFSLAPDGTSFSLDPETGADIASVPDMTTAFFDRPDNYETLRASGINGDERSRLIARVIRDPSGAIQTSADLWGHGNFATGAVDSGFYAWGSSTTSQVDLDALNGAGVSLNFSGRMSVDFNTNASLTINYGAQPSWAGTWTNPGYTFGAGGRVSGADFLSSADQFTNNVGANSFVQGALLGERDNQSIAHIIQVDLAGVGLVKDVGLLQQAGIGP